MNNLIHFTAAAKRRVSDPVMDSRVGSALRAEPPDHSHAVQFYETEAYFYAAVGGFLGAGLEAGDRVAMIILPAHREELRCRLVDFGGARAIESGQLLIADAEETLAKFMIGDMPDADLFHHVVGRMFAGMLEGHPGARLRVYGEMVEPLRRNHNTRAAMRLEELVNEASQHHAFTLLCAYSMANFHNESDAGEFREVCRSHSHVLPTETFTQLEDPRAWLREISFLQQRAHALETEIRQRRELEDALRDALQERSHAEEELRVSVTREHEARERAEASDAVKEVFMGMLGHDLRSPLNAILMTARLMAICGEFGADSQKRLARLVSSGVRMERMIEQILDMTRARLTDGTLVSSGAQHDLVPIVTKIVDELRGANPARRIELQAATACIAHVDPDRLEQVVSNLIGNAVTHGDPTRPVTVTVTARGQEASVRVHNHGQPIEPAFLPVLFDPFKRGGSARGRSQGLGLGLYIADRIVRAHGGRIEVASSPQAGTTFEVILPQQAV